MDNWYTIASDGSTITTTNWNSMTASIWCQGGISGSYARHSGNKTTAHNMDIAVSSQSVSGGSLLITTASFNPVNRAGPAPVIGQMWFSSNGTDCGGLFACTGATGGWKKVTIT